MSEISTEKANILAMALNKACESTLHALQTGNNQEQASVLAAIRDFRRQFDKRSEIYDFLKILERWLNGRSPTSTTLKRLDNPFREALLAMFKELPSTTPATPSQAPQQDNTVPPVSRRVLTQLISAIVMAAKSDNVALQQKLATQLINIQAKLNDHWKTRMGGLFENLRSVLGGVDPHLLPPVPDSEYQTLWQNTVQVLQQTEVNEGTAQQQLLDRLVNNARFTIQSKKPELTKSFMQVLEDVQYQAQSSDSMMIVTLVAAIRSYLQGSDPTPFAALLKGEELDAWNKIMEVTR